MLNLAAMYFFFCDPSNTNFIISNFSPAFNDFNLIFTLILRAGTTHFDNSTLRLAEPRQKSDARPDVSHWELWRLTSNYCGGKVFIEFHLPIAFRVMEVTFVSLQFIEITVVSLRVIKVKYIGKLLTSYQWFFFVFLKGIDK